ncbi:CAP domain-containing protein [Yoonia sp.]|uniref:CAP domain-containing protein n=1 Tax=Yoonia sp. TaxID=2212373 RepID=UPI00358E5CF8
MRVVFSFTALCLTAACGGAGGSMSTLSTSTAPVVVSTAPSNAIEDGLNNARAVFGVNAGPVEYDSRLGEAAQRHANDMYDNNLQENISHTGTDGSTLGSRTQDAEYYCNPCGENIGWNQADEAAVLEAWMNSPGHRGNNLNPDFEDFALAKAGNPGNQYWVLVLGSE